MDNKTKQFLQNLSQKGKEQQVPNITETNAQFLHFLLRHKKAQTVLEIGTAHGYSTLWLANAVKPWKGTLTTIEISSPSYCQSLQNFQEAGFSDAIFSLYGDAQKILKHWKQNIQIIQHIKEVPKGVMYLESDGLLYKKETTEMPDTYDVIFLDAQKSLYHEFWQLLSPFLKADTLIIVDDIGKFSEKTKRFVQTIEKEKDFDFVILPIDEDDGIMLIQRKSFRE